MGIEPWLVGNERRSVTDVVVADLGEPALVGEHDSLGTLRLDTATSRDCSPDVLR